MAEGEPVAEATQVVNDDGSFAENWHEPFGEENKAHLSRYKTFDDLVNSHIATKKKFGKNPDSLIELPTEKSSDEVRAAFHKARGVPDTEADYKFEKSLDISEKVEVSDAMMKAAMASAKKHNLTNKQFTGFVNDYLLALGPDIDAFDTSQAEKKQQAEEEGNAVLAKHFLDGADDRKAMANALLDKYGLKSIKMPNGDDATIKGMLLSENPGVLSSPYFLMFLDNIRESMSEDTLKGVRGTSPATAADVKTKITEIRSRMDVIIKENPSNFKGNAEFKDLQKRKTELYQQAKK